ncbi:MAG TPA: hypothetical protein ENN80_07205 [Candidatus Hydrogenedentes bacterium]|nr:hypothetical protein [Candidatus Hydrogenedentota bacterium]
MGIEGEPAGWGSISVVRVSAWRLRNEDTVFYLGALTVVGDDADLAVISPDRALQLAPSEAHTARRCAETIANHLDALELPFAVLSDADLTPERLRRKKLVIVPYSPVFPEGMGALLAGFLEEGGALVTFYTMADEIEPLVGFSDGAYVREAYPGQFSSIRPAGDQLVGMPATATQHSGNIHAVPLNGTRGRPAAYWHDAEGKRTDYPAVVISDNCAFMTHVMLPDDGHNKRQLLLAMVGHFLPPCWRQAAKASLERAGRIGPYGGFDEARKAIEQQAWNDDGLAALEQASKTYAGAREKFDAKAFAGAMAAATEAGQHLRRAYCAIQKPEPGEHRAFWCHNAFGLPDKTWDEAIRILAENGFTAILPNMLWGGVAYYPSDVLPVATSVAQQGDPVAACLEACNKYGIECHVWKVNYNMSSRSPKDFVDRMVREGRVQVMRDGKTEPRWLCPSHPENQQLEIDAMLEVATKYDVDGVHFDYIRYPGAESCFCEGCRARFEASIGKTVKNWPDDVQDAPVLREQWYEFRRKQITTVVAGVSQRLRKTRPDVEISAAVFKNWPIHRDTVGQDWKLWCDKGYLDFVCPMDYIEDNRHFEQMVVEQVQWAGDAPCYPGIGLSCWTDPGDVAKLIDQIAITRKHKTGGFTLFNYNTFEATRVVPLCGLGITRPRR